MKGHSEGQIYGLLRSYLLRLRVHNSTRRGKEDRGAVGEIK